MNNKNNNIQDKSGNNNKKENKYVIFKTNMKKENIYMKIIISVMFMKKKFITNLNFFVVHEFVLNISFLLLFTKLFTMN
jgi:hypothetical protein